MNASPRSEQLIVEPAVQADGQRTNLTRARGRRTREVILEEATILFAKYGYRGTSLRDISERVGISHPGMLHHFPHKDVLLCAVMERATHYFEELIQDFARAAENPEDIIEWDSVRQYQSLMFAVVRAEAMDPSHPGHQAVKDMQTMAERRLTEVFQRYEDAGWLEAGVSPDWVARSIVAMWTGVFMRESLYTDGLYDQDLGFFLRLVVKPLREIDIERFKRTPADADPAHTMPSHREHGAGGGPDTVNENG